MIISEDGISCCRYYHNITSNTLTVLESMAAHGVKTLIYSSTCATYGEPEKMPITEETSQVHINASACVLLYFWKDLVLSCMDTAD